MAVLARRLADRPLAAICHRLKGVFGLVIWDQRDGVWYAAVDNAGLYRLFFDDFGRLGGSFLEIAAAQGAQAADIATDRLVEFLLHGCIYAPRTLLPSIHRLRGDEIVRLRTTPEHTSIDIEPKRFPVPDVDRPFAAVVADHAEDLARSLVHDRVSIDLTGGFDSRLVASLLRARGLGDEAAMTGEPQSVDTALAAQVAAVLELPLHVHRQKLDRLEPDMAALFVASDGLVDVGKIHRDWQAALARRVRGVTVLAHGGGGELLKDFYFHHEFPFYGHRAASLERLYDLRIVPMPLSAAQLTPAAQQLVRDCRTGIISRLQSFREPTNHATCDRVFHGFRLPEFFGGHFSTYVNLGINVVAPLMDREVATAAAVLSPWTRMMEGQHRRLIHELCPQAGALPTTSGYSASWRPGKLASDVLGYGTNEVRRLVNKLGQRHLGRAPFPRAGALETDAPGFGRRTRELPGFHAGLAQLKERGIYLRDLDPMAIRPHEVGRILTLGMCFAHLQ
ncbi:MAG: hypothetical protein WAS21_22480, partial [Geminicoccaceae bacterium]